MLYFIFGRSGSGKTEYCFSEIKRLVDSGKDNLLLITPEQYNFTAEKKLLRLLGERNAGKVENSSFTRLSSEINRIYGGEKYPVITKGGKAVLMKRAIDAVKDELGLLGGKSDARSFISSMVSVSDELASCAISSDDLFEVSKKVGGQFLSRKIKDIALIMCEYNRLLDGSFVDSSTVLSRLYDKLDKTGYLNNKTVFIDGFNGFLASELKIIELIIRDCADIYVTFSGDGSSQGAFGLFSYVNKNASAVKNIAVKFGVDSKSVVLRENYRAENKEMLFCEKNIFSGSAEKYEYKPENIRLYSANSVSDECSYIAMKIKKELRSGTRARDIAVICRDSESYGDDIIYAFRKYGVPFYVDERRPVKSQPLMVFVQYLLRTVVYSYRSDDILSLIKTGLTDIGRNAAGRLENYIYVWSISGVGKWSKPFEASPNGFSDGLSEKDKAALDDINASREYICKRLDRFKSAVKTDDAREIGEAIYNALLSFNVGRNLTKTAKALSGYDKNELAQEQGRVWDILMEILDCLAAVLRNEKILLRDYLSLFDLMISYEDLGVLPQGLDNVQFGQADRIRADNPEIVFILGANEGEFPRSVISGGLLTENDRIMLKENDLELYSFGETLSIQERYFAYTALSAPRKKLYVTYIGKGAGGSPSSIVTSLKKAFPLLTETSYGDIRDVELIESEASAFELFARRFGENSVFSETLKEYFKDDGRFSAVKLLSENTAVRINDKKIATRLFGKDMYLSASRLEDYFECPFRYFCKFGLLANPREKAQMGAMETGTVIHFVLENIISEVGSPALGRMSKSEIRRLVDKYLTEYFNTKLGAQDQSRRFSYTFMRISKMLYSVVLRLADEFSQSKFEAKAFELKIDRDGAVKPKIISLDGGGSVSLRGSVDRVDILEENGEKYVRVIDYKSGRKDFRLSDILYGLNLQMFVYLFSICADKSSEYSAVPAGVLYMHASRETLGLKRDVDEKKYKDEETKIFKMKGMVLYDGEHDILRSMEQDLGGNYIPVKYTQKNGLVGCFASLEELGRISKKVDSLIVEMASELQSGNINQNPINGKNHDKTCDYCKYSSVCANRRFIGQREAEALPDEEVMKILKEEEPCRTGQSSSLTQ